MIINNTMNGNNTFTCIKCSKEYPIAIKTQHDVICKMIINLNKDNDVVMNNNTIHNNNYNYNNDHNIHNNEEINPNQINNNTNTTEEISFNISPGVKRVIKRIKDRNGNIIFESINHYQTNNNGINVNGNQNDSMNQIQFQSVNPDQRDMNILQMQNQMYLNLFNNSMMQRNMNNPNMSININQQQMPMMMNMNYNSNQMPINSQINTNTSNIRCPPQAINPFISDNNTRFINTNEYNEMNSNPFVRPPLRMLNLSSNPFYREHETNNNISNNNVPNLTNYVPNIKIPNINFPNINIPNINIPNINIPNINIPNINIPNFNIPNINIPNINIPNINIPNVNIPNNNIPNINIPRINIPNINVSNINIPNFGMPNIPNRPFNPNSNPFVRNNSQNQSNQRTIFQPNNINLEQNNDLHSNSNNNIEPEDIHQIPHMSNNLFFNSMDQMNANMQSMQNQIQRMSQNLNSHNTNLNLDSNNDLDRPQIDMSHFNLRFISRSSNAPVDQYILDALPEIKIKDVDKLDEEKKKCPICISKFVNNEKIKPLPCLHFYHTKCILDWFKKQNTCPICKFVIDDSIFNHNSNSNDNDDSRNDDNKNNNDGNYF